jgi:hypothetical protein
LTAGLKLLTARFQVRVLFGELVRRERVRPADGLTEKPSARVLGFFVAPTEISDKTRAFWRRSSQRMPSARLSRHELRRGLVAGTPRFDPASARIYRQTLFVQRERDTLVNGVTTEMGKEQKYVNMRPFFA